MIDNLVSTGGTLHEQFLSQRADKGTAPIIDIAQKPEILTGISLTETLILQRVNDFLAARRALGIVGLYNNAQGLRSRIFSITETGRSQRDIARVNSATGQKETFVFQPVFAERGGLTDWHAGMVDEFRSVADNGGTGRTFLRISLSVGKDGPKVELKVGQKPYTDPEQLMRETALHGGLRELITDQDLIDAYVASLMGKNPIGTVKPEPKPAPKTSAPPENSQDTNYDVVGAARIAAAGAEAIPSEPERSIVPSPRKFWI